MTTDTREVALASQAFQRAAQRLPTLFDLEEAALNVLAYLDDEHDMEPEDIAVGQAQLDLLDQMMMEKCESYCSVIRSLESMASARKAEADRLRDRARSAEHQAEWLKNRLLIHLQTTGQQRLETSRFTVSIRQNPPSVHVVSEGDVPREYVRTVVTTTVDKRAVLDALRRDGVAVPGTEITRSERLSIA